MDQSPLLSWILPRATDPNFFSVPETFCSAFPPSSLFSIICRSLCIPGVNARNLPGPGKDAEQAGRPLAAPPDPAPGAPQPCHKAPGAHPSPPDPEKGQGGADPGAPRPLPTGRGRGGRRVGGGVPTAPQSLPYTIPGGSPRFIGPPGLGAGEWSPGVGWGWGHPRLPPSSRSPAPAVPGGSSPRMRDEGRGMRDEG